jgi:predicted ATP-grasp superfamily ATP-dependent carboligase
MKKSIILLLGLVLLFAIPALASTPENENAPAMTSEDQQFMGLTTLSEEELMGVEGNHVIYETTKPDDYIIYILDPGGNEGYIIVYNDGHASGHNIIMVLQDGTYKTVDIYIPNFHPSNLNTILVPR